MSEASHRNRIAQDNSATERVNQPGREEGVVRVGDQPIQHERPEEWGWHGEMGKWARRLWILPLLFLIAYNFGNHRGHVEDIWLEAIALIMVLVFLYDRWRRKNAWRSK